MNDVLDIFGKESARWFAETLGAPTPVQKEAWPAIAEGRHVLVSAPTGTGKTLSAFFVFLDQMARLAHSGSLAQELQLIYVSPLKSLAADIRENLKRPLAGIGAEGKVLAAIRTGDTPQSEDDTEAAAHSDYHAGIPLPDAHQQNGAECSLDGPCGDRR